jgi:hypothetical protein
VARVDQALVARWSDERLDVMPHGGPVVMRRLLGAMSARGIAVPHERAALPNGIDERVAAALALAASPLAVDLLLDQPRRWAGRGMDDAGVDVADGRVLGRLIEPPLVAAVGPPSVGKSTLVNALAGRAVSLVAAEPGTTRDHVGVLLDVGGLVVRYLDTPGLDGDADGLTAAAIEASLAAAAAADLLVLCGDAGRAPPDVSAVRGFAGSVLRVGLRADLGRSGAGFDLRVSAKTGEGLGDLAAALREVLVPASVMADPRPWRFWCVDGRLGGGALGGGASDEAGGGST